MTIEQKNLDRLKGQNPFSVPEGYMEGLTAQIMSQVPEKVSVKEVKISLMDRVRPWLYMAAMFVGLGLFFKVFLDTGEQKEMNTSDALIVKTDVPVGSISAIQAEEDEDYLEYLEAQFADNLLADEMAASEDLK